MKPTRKWPPQIGLAIALAALMIGLAVARPNFLTLGNLVNLVRQISINGILAGGGTYVLLTGGGDFAGVPAPTWILFAVALASHVFLRHMRMGRHVYAVGGNEHAARASGVNVRGVKMTAYTICGAMAGLAGVVLAARITTGQPN